MKPIIRTIAMVTLVCGVSVQATPLYTKCVVCHGAAGEKVALGKSMIIKDMSKADFIAAMQGYKDGSYGKEQKALMKAQVGALSNAQIEEIASFVTKK
ncbi:c-type cytochrome [Sulfurospirillum deleyianum]|uniref:Putative cytochrome c n=1 Tax=Sulfurospirillum deleyianum (strain ATCC 51133 / DSM 6946 / 5175) TaxID=525898 RepID=D1B102_SULD5|nr:c-type cytochrome [Sulfurospirillum deleyianum]ACZ11772.1 putative cytochrome c [Sulfurospirillum deleyianum DSM 6946]